VPTASENQKTPRTTRRTMVRDQGKCQSQSLWHAPKLTVNRQNTHR
jgi:hypothetical protein